MFDLPFAVSMLNARQLIMFEGPPINDELPVYLGDIHGYRLGRLVLMRNNYLSMLVFSTKF